MMNDFNNCHHCHGGVHQQQIPQPPPYHGMRPPMPPPPPPPPPPPHYPYINDRHDHCGGCTHINPPPPPGPGYPSCGQMIGNAFMLINDMPYIYDNHDVQYGQKLSVSENVETRINHRTERSCILLASSFDMTDGTQATNTVLTHYLEQTIVNKYNELCGVLPIMHKDIIFTMYYDIIDQTGGIVHSSYKRVVSQDVKYHCTDIVDYCVTSCKNIFNVNIPALDYQGLYTLKIKYVTASVRILNTIEHIQNNLNPFYQFTDNNTRIMVQHDTIMSQTSFDGEVIIGALDIDYSLTFRSNVTTRMKLSFVAYMNSLICCQNTFEIWSALTEPPVDDILAQMQEELEQMRSTVDQLTEELDQAQEEIKNLSGNDGYDKAQIDKLMDGKVDKEEGKGLSSNDYTDEDKELLRTLALEGQIVFKTHLEFPNIGLPEILYVATDEACCYIWDDEQQVYVMIDGGSDGEDGGEGFDEIQGIL